MARIPQYVSNNRASTEAPAVMQRAEKVTQPIDENFGQSRLGEQIGQQISELGGKMIKVENFNAKSKSDIETTQAMLAYEDRVSKDPDPDNALKDYDTYMSKLRESTSKNFKNRQAREEYIQKFELENIVFKNKLEGVVMKKQVDIGRTNVLTSIDMETSNYINAADDSEKLKSRQKIETIMDDAVKMGFFDHEDGYKQVESTIKAAEETIKDNKALARRKEKELALAQKEAINNREREFIQMKVNGKDKLGTPISREELIKMARNDINSGAIEPKFADLYINALKTPKSVGAKSIDKDFAEVIADINKGKPEELIRKNMLKLISEGKISEDDFASAQTYLDKIVSTNVENLVPTVEKTAWFGLSKYVEENVAEQDSSRARMSRNFIKKIQSGVDANTAALEATREETLFLQPGAKNYPEGMVVIDSNGVKKKIMPNGDLLPVEEKKK